eukprot:SAG11_NODE_17386_length_520_cov_0.964371_1_plen_20_part_10
MLDNGSTEHLGAPRLLYLDL